MRILKRHLTLALLGSALAAPMAAIAAPTVNVFKNPNCGCCSGWVEHMRASGFEVTVTDVDDTAKVMQAHGVPEQLSSCHTATIGDYVIEGHVPAEDVQRLLNDNRDIAGLAAPGMPMGSPGMDMPNAPGYKVIAYTDDGRMGIYAEH